MDASLNITNGRNYLPDPTSTNTYEPDLCYLNLPNKVFCHSMEISIVVFLMFGFLFLYQIIFVWKKCYGYHIRSDSRLQIMMLALIYCMGKLNIRFNPLLLVYIFHQLTSGSVKIFLSIALGYLHYQLCAFTFIFYFKKIMNILPQIKHKWTNRLLYLHAVNSTILLLLGIVLFANTVTASSD